MQATRRPTLSGTQAVVPHGPVGQPRILPTRGARRSADLSDVPLRRGPGLGVADASPVGVRTPRDTDAAIVNQPYDAFARRRTPGGRATPVRPMLLKKP